MGSSKREARSGARNAHGLTLGGLLGQVDRHVARVVETSALAGRGLTVDQWRALDILADGEGHSMSDLATLIVVPGATLTKIMDKLVDAALVYRLVDDRDRRRVLAFLSDEGRELHAEIEPAVADTEAAMVARLGDDGAVLLALLTQLVDADDRVRG